VADLFKLLPRSTGRVNVSNAVNTSWANPYQGLARVRVATDVKVHLRVVNNDVDVATEDDFFLPAGGDMMIDVAADEHLSFLAYTEVLGTKESGSIEFSGVPVASDTITVNDGVNTAVVFTWGDGTGGTVARGATAAAAAENLRAAIQAKIDASLLNVAVARFGATLLITNNNYVGGTLSNAFASGVHNFAVTNFSGGANPGSPPLHTGSVWVTRI
jgi:hypothetical protein